MNNKAALKNMILAKLRLDGLSRETINIKLVLTSGPPEVEIHHQLPLIGHRLWVAVPPPLHKEFIDLFSQWGEEGLALNAWLD